MEKPVYMRIIFCGDWVPTEVTVPSFEKRDTEALMRTTLSVINRADFAIANLECALTERETPIRKCGPNLKGKPEYAHVISEAGFTHLGLSNNHVFDFGEQAMRDTVSTVKAVGIVPFGYTGKDHLMDNREEGKT